MGAGEDGVDADGTVVIESSVWLAQAFEQLSTGEMKMWKS